MGYLRKDGKDLTRVTVVPERSTEPNEPGDIFDPVTHPAHYCEGRTYEPKDVIMDWGVDFYIGNAIKCSEKALIFTLAIPIKVLHDKYGWGAKKRLKDFAIAMTEEYQRFNDGNMTLSEYAAMVYEYYGIKFELGDKSEDSGK